MALRALTPSKAAYCGDCGADAPPDANACASCGKPFEGSFDAILCPICNTINKSDAVECVTCAARFPEKRDAVAPTEEAYLRKILQLSREKAKARTAGPPGLRAAAAAARGEPRSMTEEPASDDLERAMWKLAEPLDRVVQNRRRRLEQMESIIERARLRVEDLAGATDPDKVSEREALKRQVEDLLLEKEDILKLEEGLVEMENTYRNILRMQQEELKARESSLRSRIEAFRKELESRERTFGQLKEREGEMVRREDEFRRLMNRVHEREQEVAQREELLREKARLLDERHHSLSEAEVDLERKRWEVQHRMPGAAPGPAKAPEGTITVGSAEQAVTEMRGRLSELEEQMERLTDERNRLSKDREDLASIGAESAAVLKALDELLGNLPDAAIQAFAKTDAFARYERLLDRLGV
jgi:DNA repair exonuclease SbcCD ATPase subunit